MHFVLTSLAGGKKYQKISKTTTMILPQIKKINKKKKIYNKVNPLLL